MFDLFVVEVPEHILLWRLGEGNSAYELRVQQVCSAAHSVLIEQSSGHLALQLWQMSAKDTGLNSGFAQTGEGLFTLPGIFNVKCSASLSTFHLLLFFGPWLMKCQETVFALRCMWAQAQTPGWSSVAGSSSVCAGVVLSWWLVVNYRKAHIFLPNVINCPENQRCSFR